MRIVQVVTCWFGWRRTGDHRQSADPLIYLRHQVAALQRHRHDLIDEIVFVLSGRVPAGTHDLIALVPKATWLKRENAGMSYGAFAHAFANVPRADRWIFCEDDYVPAVDDYDVLMLELLDRAGPRCGFSCAKLGPTTDGRPHAAAFLGMLPDAALRAVVAVRGQLPAPRGDDYNQAEVVGQIGWSLLLQNCGWTLSEWHPERELLYWDGKLVTLPGEKPALFQPVQAIKADPIR